MPARVAEAVDFESFRQAARSLIGAHVPPREVRWADAWQSQQDLLASASADAEGVDTTLSSRPLRLPRAYVEHASLAVLVRRSDRFDVPYRVLYRLTHGEPQLMQDVLDDDVRELMRRSQAVRKDEHRMHAFVRFRRSHIDGAEQYVAWYEPEHFIVPLASPFFARRFSGQAWAILTPDACAFWDGHALRYGPGAQRTAAPDHDDLESLFRTYYAATYNPARDNPPLFQKHVPRAFQRGLPELQQLHQLRRPDTSDAPASVAEAQPPRATSLSSLAAAAAHCRACPLGERATQTVFGEGPQEARVVLVGEQPGDEEDLGGRPFIGPAGRVLDRALHEAGLDRRQLYVTNAVKHFSYRPLGKKRLHARPNWNEVQACRPWLHAELGLVKPAVIVCLGATAAQSFLGRRFSVTANRGRVFETPWATHFLVAFHPSAVLRAQSEEAATAVYAALVEDLTHAAALAQARR